MSAGEWLALGGIAIAIGQLWRMGLIAKAIKAALDEATGRVSLYNFLLIVPELSRLEAGLENAAMNGESDEVRRYLKEWREAVGDLQGILTNEGLNGQQIEQLIKLSLINTTLAKTAIVSGKFTDLVRATAKARKAIEDVCIETRTLAASIRSSAAMRGILLPVPPPTTVKEKQRVIESEEA